MRGLRRILDAFPGGEDVAFDTARQPADRRTVRRADFAGDALHGLQIVGRRRRETCLDNIDAEPRQLPRDFQLFGAAQGRAGALLAVAQGGVKEQDYIFVNCRFVLVFAISG